MSNSRLPLIIQREYFSTVGKKSFIVMTILMPILMIALCAVLPIMLSQVKNDEKKNVAVVDTQNIYSSYLTDTEEYHFFTIQESTAAQARDYYEKASDVYAIVTIPDSLLVTQKLNVYSSQALNGSLTNDIRQALEPVLKQQKVESYHIDSLAQIIAQCDVDLNINSIKWAEDGSETMSSTEVAQFIGLALAFLTYMFVIMYGAMIMNGVIEEKTNRIVEVIVSSCKPMELMMGKIIGVALVGLTQVFIWGVMLFIAGLVLGVNIFATSPEIVQAAQQAQVSMDQNAMSDVAKMLMGINFGQIFTCFVLYFIGGYLLYAAMFAAFGSAVDQPNDASQFMMPIMVIMIFAFYAAMFSIESPDAPLAYWCSLIPFTSPVVMMIRLPYDVPVSQLAVSLVLLYASAFALVYLAGRIYRTGILMYGKKFTFKEILKWLKQ